jgi:CheY-like chemotaxis protein
MRSRFHAPSRTVSVLVVDGYPDVAASLALLLSIEGFAARATRSVAEARAAAAAEPPDVVILEPRTPGGGWELVRWLSETVSGKRLLIVAVTSDATPPARSAAAAAGIHAHYVKPVDPAVLIAVIRQFELAAILRSAANAGADGLGHPARPMPRPAPVDVDLLTAIARWENEGGRTIGPRAKSVRGLPGRAVVARPVEVSFGKRPHGSRPWGEGAGLAPPLPTRCCVNILSGAGRAESARPDIRAGVGPRGFGPIYADVRRPEGFDAASN